MRKQFNFLTYLYQEYNTVDYDCMIVCNRVRVTSRFGHLSFYLIHSETRLSHHLKVHQQFQYFFTLLLDENHKHKFRAISFQLSLRPLEQSILHRHLIILRIHRVVASKSVSTGRKLFGFTARRYSIARSLLPFFYCVFWKYL